MCSCLFIMHDVLEERRRQRREYVDHVQEIYGTYSVMFHTFLKHDPHIDMYNIFFLDICVKKLNKINCYDLNSLFVYLCVILRRI